METNFFQCKHLFLTGSFQEKNLTKSSDEDPITDSYTFPLGDTLFLSTTSYLNEKSYGCHSSSLSIRHTQITDLIGSIITFNKTRGQQNGNTSSHEEIVNYLELIRKQKWICDRVQYRQHITITTQEKDHLR